MKKRLLCLIITILLALSSIFQTGVQSAEQPEEEYSGYLVRLSGSPGRMSNAALSTEINYEMVSYGLCLTDDLKTARALVESGAAEFYEPNYILRLQDTPSYTPSQWNLLAVKAQAAWEHTGSEGDFDMLGDGVTVAVIDSGVYREHPDFKAGKILENYDLADDDPADGGWDGWHGTFVAGIIAAQVNNSTGTDGMSPNVTILPISVINGTNTSVATVIEAIDYAVSQNADVINLSIGGNSGGRNLEEACQRAVAAGIIVVASAGNYLSGQTKSSGNYMYPASYDCVVSVSACRQDGDVTSGSAVKAVFDEHYSYFNDRVTVAAPGTGIVSLYIDDGTKTDSGTSFSAPAVSAMAAMVKQRNRAVSPAAFKALLCESTDDLGDSGYDPYYGSGFVNIEKFAEILDSWESDKPLTGTAEIIVSHGAYGDPDCVDPGDTLSLSLSLNEEGQSGGAAAWYDGGTLLGSGYTYTVGISDAGRTIHAVYTAPEGWSGTLSTDTVTVEKAVLGGTLLIEQTSEIRSGDILSLTAESRINGASVQSGSTDYGLQWLRDGQPVYGETYKTYMVKKEDRGKKISLTAEAKGLYCKGSVYSNEVEAEIEIPSVTLAAAPGDKQAVLSWQVIDNGGSAVTKFSVYLNDLIHTTLPASSASYTFTGLENGISYKFKLEAYNLGLGGVQQYGFSEASATPAAPEGGEIDPGGGGGGGGGGGAAMAPMEPRVPLEPPATMTTLAQKLIPLEFIDLMTKYIDNYFIVMNNRNVSIILNTMKNALTLFSVFCKQT